MPRPADTTALDRAYFRANPNRNARVRDPMPGEPDELARMLLPAGMPWEGGFQVPEGQKLRVIAMRVSFRDVVRFLATVPLDPGPLPDSVVVPIMIGERVALG